MTARIGNEEGPQKRPHPGVQLRFTDRDGMQLTALVTNIIHGQPPDLELQHRQRARCEEPIHTAMDTDLRNLPFYDFDANRIRLGLGALAVDLTVWKQTLVLADHSARG
ncbi:transposase [Nocardia sp. CA2R105]|nr:transposase [Nocardia coffeae]